VSDLLTRLAARAVGVPPLAAPRPATPFEREPQGDLLELVAEVPARPQVQAPMPGARPAPPAPGGERSRDERVRGEAAAAPGRGEPPAASEAGAERTPSVVREDLWSPSSAAPEPELEAVLPAWAARGEGLTPAHGEDVPAPAAPAATAVVAVPATRPASAAAPPAPPGELAPAAPEAPAVRVHIGRLEVRANLEQPRSEPTRRSESLEPALSLSDYLRRSGGAR